MLDLAEILKCSQYTEICKAIIPKLSLSALSPFGRVSSLDTDFSFFFFFLFECVLFFSKDLLCSGRASEMLFAEALWMHSTHCAPDSQRGMKLGNSHHSCPGLEQDNILVSCQRGSSAPGCWELTPAAFSGMQPGVVTSQQLGCTPNTMLGAQQPLGKDFFTVSGCWSSALGSGNLSWLEGRDCGGLGYLQ